MRTECPDQRKRSSKAVSPHARATEPGAQRRSIGALRAVSARKARGRPKPFVLTDFGNEIRE